MPIEQKKIDSSDLLDLNIIDEIIEEPIGGAHRNKEQIISSTKEILIKYLITLKIPLYPWLDHFR